MPAEPEPTLQQLYDWLMSYHMCMEGIVVLLEAECRRLSPGGRLSADLKENLDLKQACRDKGQLARMAFEEYLMNEKNKPKTR